MKCLHILKACLIHHFIQFQVYLHYKNPGGNCTEKCVCSVSYNVRYCAVVAEEFCKYFLVLSERSK